MSSKRVCVDYPEALKARVDAVGEVIAAKTPGFRATRAAILRKALRKGLALTLEHPEEFIEIRSTPRNRQVLTLTSPLLQQIADLQETLREHEEIALQKVISYCICAGMDEMERDEGIAQQ